MSPAPAESRPDLVVVVADLDMEYVLRALVGSRHQDLGFRSIRIDVKRHPRRDSGCRCHAAEFLRTDSSRFGFALVVFDLHGSGADHEPARSVERSVERDLARNGWSGDRARCVVIEPELENWVWQDTPALPESIGWRRDAVGGRTLRDWCRDHGRWPDGRDKPMDPKPTFRRALQACGTKHSAELFGYLARTLPLDGCTDRAFLRLRRVLRTWFPAAR